VPVSNDYLDYVLEQLRELEAVTTRRMFGGIGIYQGESFFAVIDDDVLYLKVGDTNRADFEDAGQSRFQPMGSEGPSMSYYTVPAEVLESPEQLAQWSGKSIEIAKAAADKKKTKKKTKKRTKKKAKKKPARKKPK